MIILHRLKGEALALNPDLFEKIEAVPDTTITLVDGNKYNVAESIDEVVLAVMEYRARVVSMAHQMDAGTYSRDDGDGVLGTGGISRGVRRLAEREG